MCAAWRRQLPIRAVCILLAGLLAQAGAASSAVEDLPARGPRILYKLHGSTEPAPFQHELHAMATDKGGRSLRRLRQAADGASGLRFQSLGQLAGLEMVQMPHGQASDWLLQALQSHPGVEFAEEDRVLSAYSTPNDPDLPQQWAMYRLGLFTDTPLQRGTNQGAWNRTKGSDGVVVCVIDSGVDYTHPDLQGNIWTNKGEIPGNGVDDDCNGYIDDVHGYNFLANTGDPMDNNFHGTHLSGMVGALCNNNMGICGVAPNVRVMGCKFLDAKGNGYTSDAVRCLEYALANGADITLNSYGGLYADSASLKTAIGVAERRGQLFVTAAGNDYGTNIDATPTYPASYNNSNVVSVIATDQANRLANYSNYGRHNADIAAPGSRILSTILHGQYGMHEGTSQSAGYVAGGAALLLAAYRAAGFANMTGLLVKDALMAGVVQTDDLAGKCESGGMLDMGRAMALVPYSSPQRPLRQGDKELLEPATLANRPLALPAPAWASGVQGGGRAPGAAPAPEPRRAAAGSGSGTLAHDFSGAFPLQHASLMLLPLHGRGYRVCLAQHPISRTLTLPSNPAPGRDVTAEVLAAARSGRGLPITLGGEGFPMGADTALVVERQIGVLVADWDMGAGGQVLVHTRPDRLVATYLNMSVRGAPSSVPRSAFQAELFTAAGHFQPAGAVRLTWLAVGAAEGVVGVSSGAGPVPAAANFTAVEACVQPPRLELQPERLPLVEAPVALRMSLIRRAECDGHFIVLSVRPEAPRHRGEPGTLWLGFPCGRKELVAGAGARFAGASQQNPSPCLDFSSAGVSVALGADRVTFADDACATLAAAHALGAGPLYLFLGAYCAGDGCRGGAVWESLEVDPSAGGALDWEEGVAAVGQGEVVGDAVVRLGSEKRVAAAQGAMLPPTWVALATTAVAVAPGSDATVELLFSGAHLASGMYEAALVVRGNDPARPVTRMPIALSIP
ncbi:hypothetical protein WJX81_001957 [Elliptochloris bilobata]|uniref:Peptidase S8/S53 domain-containing protein n=1 Tax=Elliptochloris bilobata TaxID=381761 RepID=A0AAW1S0U2_9CHLO